MKFAIWVFVIIMTVAIGVQAGQVEIFVGQLDTGSSIAYMVELEVTADASLSSARATGPGFDVPLVFDNGEVQFDVDSGELTLGELNGILGGTVTLELVSGLGTTTYSINTNTGGFTGSEFPVPLPVITSVDTPNSPTRPRVMWTSGDPSAFFAFITYYESSGNDEFTEGIDPLANSYEFQQDLAPGDYGAFLAYGNFLTSLPITKTNSGPDLLPTIANLSVLGIADEDPSVTIVPEPISLVLLGLLGMLSTTIRRRDMTQN